VSISEYFSGIITELVGIIVTVLFVQVLFDKKNTNEQKEHELAEIKRFHRILKLYIDRYIRFYNRVATPLGEKVPTDPFQTGKFKIKDMCDLHEISLFITDGSMKPAIDIFYEIEHIIRDYFITTLLRIDFEYFPDISELIISFIDISIRFDSSGEILYAKNIRIGDKPAIAVNKKMIQENGEEFYNEFIKGNRQNANSMHPYAYLYMMMQEERKILVKYLKIINDKNIV
jgi:hypothetical protein